VLEHHRQAGNKGRIGRRCTVLAYTLLGGDSTTQSLMFNPALSKNVFSCLSLGNRYIRSEGVEESAICLSSTVETRLQRTQRFPRRQIGSDPCRAGLPSPRYLNGNLLISMYLSPSNSSITRKLR